VISDGAALLAEPLLSGLHAMQFSSSVLGNAAEATWPPLGHQPIMHTQGRALGSSEQFCTITTSYREPVQVKVFHSVEKDDPIPVPEARFTVLKPLEDYAVRVGNRPTSFIFPISDRYPIGLAGRF
jgi:hypothetical protein